MLCLLFLFLSGGILQCINPSVLWRCWLGDRKGIRPVKNWVVGAGMVICLERDADLHMAQLMPRPLTVSCFSKIQIGFTFLVPAHLGSPGKRVVKRVCVCFSTCWLSGSAWQELVRSCFCTCWLSGSRSQLIIVFILGILTIPVRLETGI